MAIKYYRSEAGIFTVIADTQVFNGVTLSNVGTFPPWEEVATTLYIGSVSTYREDILGIVANKVKSVDLFYLYGLTTTSQTFTYNMEGSEDYKIVSSERYYGNIADIRVINKIRVPGPIDVRTSEGYSPYGKFTSQQSGGSDVDYIQFEVILSNDEMTDFKFIGMTVYNNGSVEYNLGDYASTDMAALAEFFGSVQPIQPSGDDPDPYEDAGGGEGSLGGDIIGLPTEPTLSPIDAGLFSLYSPTAAQMRNLADFLWTDFGGTGTTVEEVLEEVVEALKRSVSNPLNSMLGLSIIASQGLSKGSDSSVRVGFWNTGVSMTKITKQYFTVNCGSLSFSPVCGNTFLDYAPYSKFMIYLPYVGMRLLDANDVVGHTISIRYRGDCVSGALTCYVIRDGSVIQEHTGSCALNIPLTADSWAESISAVGRIISGSVSGATRGGVAGAAAGAVRGAASVATNPSAFSSQVAHTGAVSGAAGHLGSQKPFILREAVRFHSTSGFNSIIGYPSYYYRKLGDCRGYTQCLEVHLSHTPCTGVELQEIEELLKKGVII